MEKNLTEQWTDEKLPELRWAILKAADAARVTGVSLNSLHSCINQSIASTNTQEIAREVEYLKGKGLITVLDEFTRNPWAKITPNGTDVVEYRVECPVGIFRIKKYWG